MQFLDEKLDLNYYNKLKKVCKGNFNKVFEVIDNETKAIYAAKTPLKDTLQFTEEETMTYCQDINISSKLNHPSIIGFVGFNPLDFKNRKKPVVVTEFASNNSLHTIISELENHPEWTFTKRIINIYGIASAMSYLHSHNIIHCDLNTKNVLVDKDYYPKLYNFKFAQEVTYENPIFKKDEQLNDLPSLKYLSPETIENSEYSKSSDVYSFSRIIFEVINDKRNGKPMPECYKRLIERCSSKNPDERPTFDEIIELLETDPDYMINDINLDEYMEYIRMIKEYPVTFDSTQSIVKHEDLIRDIKNIKQSETIEKLLKSKNPKELMIFLNDNCDEKTTSSVFDRCFADFPDIYQELCREGIAMNNSVANQKHALSVIFEKDNDKEVFKSMRSYLEDSVKKGFVSSYYSLARLSYIFFNKEKLAFNLAKAGSKIGEKYSKCLLGYFYAHGIGTKRDHKKGVTIMLESGADDYYDMFATDIGVYCIEELHSQAQYLLNKTEAKDENENEKKQSKEEEKAETQNENKEEEKFETQKENENKEKEKIETQNENENKEKEKIETQNENENKEEEKIETQNENENKEEEKIETQNENENNEEKSLIEDNDIIEIDYDEYDEDEALVEYEEVIEYEEEEELNDNTAFRWFSKAYRMNKTKVTINNYGLCYLHGIGVPKDIKRAKEIFYNDPEKRGLVDFSNIVFLLEEPNPAESLKNMMEKLIQEGNFSIPIEYATNLYKMRQYKQAFNYFSLISKSHNPVAKFFVGVMKFKGEGCERNVDESYQILKELSVLGFDVATRFINEIMNLS